MTSAWQYPVQSHPWFRMPSLKRKAIEREDSSSSADYSDFERFAHPSKRFRCGILESGFAQLSLDAAAYAPVVTEPPSSYPSADILGASAGHGASAGAFSSINGGGGITWDGTTYDALQVDPQRVQSVVLPGSVEEPTSSEASTVQNDTTDVTMKSRSWYEPEKDRIVIVDLDDSDVEDTTDDSPQVTVNSVLLSRIKGQTEPMLASRRGADSSMALVLFKPLPIPNSRTDVQSQEPPSQAEASGDGPVVTNFVDLDVDIVDTDSTPMDVDDAMEVE